ncbi:dipeptide/oligopeptide ABC transporter permease protein [Rhizobium etli 8C-3]|uniref:Peptide/nickel transport system permease protein n=2 Tax=Rhizobium TaxID=379 RepID=A0A4R3RTP0_9HYPH|nr:MULTISPECIES: ABC transporter permease [Rhizobium]APO72938.1 dipeptide/oligopeptide ABC transporter permease protein [Rhizobium etli 8C-3]TCU26954.1 peptide/nickel transport system permease protein [Rhizobium azibense]TCU38901.1 peptide/nickel transport system permease protein [Rhizobium azibense]
MLSFVLQRLLQSVIVVLILSIVLFVGVWMIGNPADILISSEASEADRLAAIAALGLDKPLWQQYLVFLGNAVQGDWGASFVYKEPAISIILQRLPASLELGAVAFLIAVTVSVPAGLYSGLRPQSPVGRGVMAFSLIGVSIPTFWQGMLLIVAFGIALPILPVGDRGQVATHLGITSSLWTLDGWSHIVMPAFSLALLKMSLLMRVTRAATMEISRLDFVKFAYAKGVRTRKVIVGHILRNALVPLITVTGIELGNLLAYGVITETVFSWPGLGKLLINSIKVLDRPLIVAQLTYTALLFIAINFIVDVLHMAIDPRVKSVLGQRT